MVGLCVDSWTRVLCSVNTVYGTCFCVDPPLSG